MMSRLVYALMVLLLSGLSGNVEGLRLRGIPTIPTGVGGPIAAMGAAFQENKGPKKDEGPLINKLKENAEHIMEEQVAQDLRTLGAKKEAYLLAHQNLVKLVYIGGCPRAYSALCPKGWTESPGQTCTPPEAYSGPCGKTALGMFAAADKEDFAWRCRASWACEDSCAKEFSGCPSGWKLEGSGTCAAPANYDGICSPTTNFETFSNRRKAEWATMCSAKWPCAGPK